MKKPIILFIFLIIISFLNCDESEDTSYKYKTVTIQNNTGFSVTVYYASENDNNSSVSIWQKTITIPICSITSIEIQYEIFTDGQFTAVYNNIAHTQDVDTSSDADESVTLN
jgi:hypothetical protein